MQMAIAITLHGFNNLGCSVTRIFLSIGHFLYRLTMFCEKNEENLSSRSLNFLQNAPSNSIHLTSSFSCVAVSNATLTVRVCEMMAIFEINNATDLLIITIGCLC